MSLPSKANLWVSIEHFKKEDALSLVKMREAAIGHTLNKNRSKNLAKKETELVNLVKNYKHLSIKDYMNNVICFYNHDIDR